MKYFESKNIKVRVSEELFNVMNLQSAQLALNRAFRFEYQTLSKNKTNYIHIHIHIYHL